MVLVGRCNVKLGHRIYTKTLISWVAEQAVNVYHLFVAYLANEKEHLTILTKIIFANVIKYGLQWYTSSKRSDKLWQIFNLIFGYLF